MGRGLPLAFQRESSWGGHSQPPLHPVRRYVSIAALLAAVALLLVGLRAAGLLGYLPSGSAIPGTETLACPARHAGGALWVPAKPLGIDGHARLAPLQTPNSAVICAYPGSDMGRQTGWRLSDRRVLTSGLSDLADLLAWQPLHAPHIPAQVPEQGGGLCSLVGGPQTDFLIGLTYRGGGKLWVSGALDPNLCVGSSNGEFFSQGDIGITTSKAFSTGRWPAIHLPSCTGTYGQAGRLGQRLALVPAGSTLVTICSGHHTRLRTSNDRALISALNALPSFATTYGCSGVPAGPGYDLYFSYPHGPPVVVTVNDGCRPEIEGLGLQAKSSSSILPIIRQMLGTKG